MIRRLLSRIFGKRFVKFQARFLLWNQTTNQFAQFEDIRLCDLSYGGPDFKRVLIGALQLLKDIDPRRFLRVNRHLKWIANEPLAQPGAQYRHLTQTCSFDFVKPESESDIPFWIANHASVLVHEATHGVLRVRGIPYSPELRARIEHLCVTEQNRFARRLATSQPEIAERLHREFDESEWHDSWDRTNTGTLIATLRRIHRGRHK